MNKSLQNDRAVLLDSFGMMLRDTGLSAEELYELSPPPTKILMDFIARQVNPGNDELYQSIIDYNSFSKDYGLNSKAIRDLFGERFLREAQARAKKTIDSYY